MNITTEPHKINGMVQIWGWQCERCDHEWLPRNRERKPKVCPKCKSPYWNKPRQQRGKTDNLPKDNIGRMIANDRFLDESEASQNLINPNISAENNDLPKQQKEQSDDDWWII
jgi:NAD-dependent SIR2 family protein deacetylase